MPDYQDTSKPKVFSNAALYFTANVRTSQQTAVPAETRISASKIATPIALLVVPLSCLLLLPLFFFFFIFLLVSMYLGQFSLYSLCHHILTVGPHLLPASSPTQWQKLKLPLPTFSCLYYLAGNILCKHSLELPNSTDDCFLFVSSVTETF